jgi:hypothetical protein
MAPFYAPTVAIIEVNRAVTRPAELLRLHMDSAQIPNQLTIERSLAR